MDRKIRPVIWLARHPLVLIVGGVVVAVISLAVSFFTGQWHWFPRGGALLALSGFIVSVTEAILYLAPAPPIYKSSSSTGLEGFARIGPRNVPAFNPQYLSMSLQNSGLTPEEIDKEVEEAEHAWNEANLNDDLVLEKAGEPGRKMRDLSELSDAEYRRLRLAAVCGISGTLIWALGDLLGGLPK